MAGRLIWLPDPSAPPDGSSSRLIDLPLNSTRPGTSVETSGVFSQIPGSADEPSVAIVVPSFVSPAGSGAATAAARSSAVVVSNWATVRAPRGGGGGGVGSNVSTRGGAGTAAATTGASVVGGTKTSLNCCDVQPAKSETEKRTAYFIKVTVLCVIEGSKT